MFDFRIDIVVCHECVIVCPTSTLDIIQTVLVYYMLLKDFLVSNVVLAVEHAGHLSQVVFRER